MNKYCCITCSFYNKAGDTTGVCFVIGAMEEKGVLILDKFNIIEKISTPDQTVYTPIIVPNLFGCVYHKEMLKND